ncbi:MAG: nucleoside deaminase [Deltaproteobacteria bacterium]|nr:MAG: nucleoside deaminase [Deltaproteobacteria bacterium]
MSLLPDHEKFMKAALQEAQKAFNKKEVPIGAVAVQDGKIIARAHNLRESKNDPLGHAEIILLQKLTRKLKRWRMNDLLIYVTLEPCLMCMGALMQARIGHLIFGALDPKAGACGSLYDFSQDFRLNHRIQVVPFMLQQECSSLLSLFFKKIRLKKKIK